MKYWTTEIMAICPHRNELRKWSGDYIQAPTQELAQEWCDNNGKGYLKVTGELISEIDFDSDNRTDYDVIQNN